jgi:hypothetical protein
VFALFSPISIRILNEDEIFPIMSSVGNKLRWDCHYLARQSIQSVLWLLVVLLNDSLKPVRIHFPLLPTNTTFSHLSKFNPRDSEIWLFVIREEATP